MLKKIVVLILVLSVALSSTACTRKVGEHVEIVPDWEDDAYKTASAANDYIEAARWECEGDGLTFLGYDIIFAAYSGMYRDEAVKDGVGYLAEKLDATEEEIIEGITYVMCGGTDTAYMKASNAIKEEYRDNATEYFALYEDNIASFCVSVAIGVAETNGTIDEIENNLSRAKEKLDYLHENYPDDENYSQLLGRYEASVEYFNFLQNPTGTVDDIHAAQTKYEEVMEESFYPVCPKTEQLVPEYETIEPPAWVMWLLFVFSVIVSVALMIYSKKREMRMKQQQSTQ